MDSNVYNTECVSYDTVIVTVRRYRHRRDKITARSTVSTPPPPLTIRISDSDVSANSAETDAIFKLGE